METTPEQVRRHMRCGYIPPAEHVEAGIWEPDGKREQPLTLCAGYTTSLPEVVDVAMAYSHWEAGSLRELCAGPVPRPLLDGLAILKGSVHAHDQQRIEDARNRKDGG